MNIFIKSLHFLRSYGERWGQTRPAYSAIAQSVPRFLQLFSTPDRVKMSTVTFWTNLFLVVIFISQTIVINVDGIPVKKKPPKIVQKLTSNTTTTKILPKSIQPIKKSNTRDPRFLGKLSVVAGLHLPNPPTMSPIHRNDIVHKKRVPTQYVTTYNFPPSSWGPYAAAVYEPPPIPSFLEDPLGYFAAILNPYNWFNSSFATTNTPTTVVTVVPDEVEDEVFVTVHDLDNEIPNEERMDKIKMKAGHHKINNRKYITKRTPFELSTAAGDYTTTSYSEESDADLVAEETTIKHIENIRRDTNFQDDSRQLFGHKTKTTELPTRSTQPLTRRTSTQTRRTPTQTRLTQPQTRPTPPHSRPTPPQTRPTPPQTRPTPPQTRPTPPQTIPTDPPTRPTIPEIETLIPENNTLPTQNTSTLNGTMNVTPSPTNTTSQTFYPLNNVTYPIYNHGYYYGGRPQNVSNIELTTSKATQIDHRIQSFNDVNQYLQPYQPNYQEFDDPPSQESVDFFRRFEQLPPLPNNYYDETSKVTFNSMNDNNLNGFKPSFPLLF